MINGLYSACSGMYTQQIRLDVISSNIANASVPGFKGERIVFSSYPDASRIQADRPGAEPEYLGPLGGGARIDEITTNYEEGSLVRTGEESDLALFGEGFFHLDTPAGERLTRNGSFMQDSEGWLVNSSGHFLLGEKGRIQIPESKFDVSSSGEIYVHREVATPDGRRITRTVEVDRLKLSQPGNPETLERLGDSLYFLPSPDLQPVDPEGIRVGQGYLEMANVNAIEQSIQLVDTFRSYEASQRLVRAIDDTLDLVINQVGR